MHVATSVVLLLLVTGLSRLLVVCDQPCCGGHVKLSQTCELAVRDASASSTPSPTRTCGCCRRTADAGSQPRPPRTTWSTPPASRCADPVRAASRGATPAAPSLQPTCGGCKHHRLATELSLPPTPIDFDAVIAAALPRLPVFTVFPSESTEDVPHPPATGPPRTDARTELRACSVLRL